MTIDKTIMRLIQADRFQGKEFGEVAKFLRELEEVPVCRLAKQMGFVDAYGREIKRVEEGGRPSSGMLVGYILRFNLDANYVLRKYYSKY